MQIQETYANEDSNDKWNANTMAANNCNIIAVSNKNKS